MLSVYFKILFLILYISTFTLKANPYWDETIIQKDPLVNFKLDLETDSFKTILPEEINAHKNLRLLISWGEGENYVLEKTILEQSGTDALLARAKKPRTLGSYIGILRFNANGQNYTYYDSIGTGKEYRKLARALSFRFPYTEGATNYNFEMIAEHPQSGEMLSVLNTHFNSQDLEQNEANISGLEYRLIKSPEQSPSLKTVIYADGYLENKRQQFWQDAKKTVDALVNSNFPGYKKMEFVAVFAPSNKILSAASNLGLPVQRYDSFLGLYFPYWNGFGRWYHVVYTTDEDYFRQNQAVYPYDYNIVLIDSAVYWGVGNFKTHTAIPARSSSFTYLLLHELGHFLGLNEEYEGGGRTELEFAESIKEAWSQNMTFLPVANLISLKWTQYITNRQTPVPTPANYWAAGKYGAYRGGYADSVNTHSHSHKPGFNCVMSSGNTFCPICLGAINDIINFDLGL